MWSVVPMRVVLGGLLLTLSTCSPATVKPENPSAEDLRYLANTVRQIHPALSDVARLQKFNQQLEATLAKALPSTNTVETYALAAGLLASLGDGHTWAQPPQTEKNLPLLLNWVSDGLVVEAVANSMQVSPGDEVRKLGGRTSAELLEVLRTLVPGENDGHVRSLGAKLLRRGSVLQALGLVSDSGAVQVEIQRPDSSVVQTEVLISDQPLQLNPRASFGWKLEPTLGLFWMDSCDNTPEYQKAVSEFFAAVKQSGVKRIAVDVRQNGGGNSQVIDALLSYLPADSVLVFHKPGNSNRQTVQHASPDLIFRGEVYALIGPYTFSSANWIAGVIHDNALGKLIGEPTGNAPTSYGNINRYTTPHLGLVFTVSKNLWLRPDPRFDPANSLPPDIPVPQTIADVQAGHDPVLAWLAAEP